MSTIYAIPATVEGSRDYRGNADAESHIISRSNPHNVTADQTGAYYSGNSNNLNTDWKCKDLTVNGSIIGSNPNEGIYFDGDISRETIPNLTIGNGLSQLASSKDWLFLSDDGVPMLSCNNGQGTFVINGRVEVNKDIISYNDVIAYSSTTTLEEDLGVDQYNIIISRIEALEHQNKVLIEEINNLKKNII